MVVRRPTQQEVVDAFVAYVQSSLSLPKEQAEVLTSIYIDGMTFLKDLKVES